MKTTIDIPEEMVARAKIEAAKRKTTLKSLVIEGLEAVLNAKSDSGAVEDALERLERGLRLGGKYIARDDLHTR